MRWIILAAGVTMAVQADAQNVGERRQAEIFRALVDCRTVTGDAARLVCYDRNVAAIAMAERSGDIVVADKAQIRETKKALFGFGGVRLPLLGGDDAHDAPKQIEAKITALRDLGYGKYEFALDNGMRWRQTEDDNVYPAVGQIVVVKVAAMGSYMMRVKSRAVRVIRVR